MKKITDHQSRLCMIFAGLSFITMIYVAYGALYPFNFSPPSSEPLLKRMFAGLHQIQGFDVIQNLLFYLPLGFFSYLFWHNGLKRCHYCATLNIIIFAFICSFVLESFQLFIPSRFPSVLDIILNTLSAFLGALIAQGIQRFVTLKGNFQWLQKTALTKPVSWLSLLIIILWAGYHLYPYIPSLHPSHLKLNIQYIMQGVHRLPNLEYIILVRYFAEGSGLALLFSLLFKRGVVTLMLLFFISVIFLSKFLIITRVVSIESIIAMISVIMLCGLVEFCLLAVPRFLIRNQKATGGSAFILD